MAALFFYDSKFVIPFFLKTHFDNSLNLTFIFVYLRKLIFAYRICNIIFAQSF